LEIVTFKTGAHSSIYRMPS